MVKCDICRTETNSLLRVKHRKQGIIKICFDCWEVEQGNQNLLHMEGGCGCCR